jgi:hypothetical protein
MSIKIVLGMISPAWGYVDTLSNAVRSSSRRILRHLYWDDLTMVRVKSRLMIPVSN